MRINVFLVVGLLSISGIAQSQVSKDAFEKAVNFVNCKYVEHSLKNSNKKGVIEMYQKNCNCQNQPSFDSIISGIQKSEEKTIELSKEIEKVKLEFNDDLDSDEVIKRLTDDIFLNKEKYQKLFEFSNKRKGNDDFDELKKEIAKSLPQILEPTKQAKAVNNSMKSEGFFPKSVEERLSALEKKSEIEKEPIGWFSRNINIFVITSLILSSLLLILKFIEIFNRGNRVSDDVKKYVKEKVTENNGGISAQLMNTTGISSLQARVTKVENDLKGLKTSGNSTNIPLDIVTPRYEQSWQDKKQQEEKTETFFLSTPNADGTFNASSVSSIYKEGASIYKFTKLGNDRAEFQIDDREASVKLALTYPDKNIDPVCDAVNAFDSKAIRIATVEVGKAELFNDKWIVNKSQKAKISYES